MLALTLYLIIVKLFRFFSITTKKGGRVKSSTLLPYFIKLHLKIIYSFSFSLLYSLQVFKKVQQKKLFVSM